MKLQSSVSSPSLRTGLETDNAGLVLEKGVLQGLEAENEGPILKKGVL